MKWNEANIMVHYPEPYIEYLIYFHMDRDFFECHEVLEEYWKSVPNSPFRDEWHGFIQVAVALYHQRRGNIAGARKMLASAIHNLNEQHLELLGLNASVFSKLLFTRLEQMNRDPKAGYEDINFPFADNELVLLCQNHPLAANKTWLAVSDFDNLNLINKHTLRDRSDIVLERQRQLLLKQKSRGFVG
jgi:predicted metal-dependent hydrolase